MTPVQWPKTITIHGELISCNLVTWNLTFYTILSNCTCIFLQSTYACFKSRSNVSERISQKFSPASSKRLPILRQNAFPSPPLNEFLINVERLRIVWRGGAAELKATPVQRLEQSRQIVIYITQRVRQCWPCRRICCRRRRRARCCECSLSRRSHAASGTLLRTMS